MLGKLADFVSNGEAQSPTNSLIQLVLSSPHHRTTPLLGAEHPARISFHLLCPQLKLLL